MIEQTERGTVETAQLGPWIELLDQLSQGAVNLTIGLVAGSRTPNQRAALDRLAMAGLQGPGLPGAGSSNADLPSADLPSAGSSDAGTRGASGSSLLVRLSLGADAIARRQLRSARASEQAPTPVPSPLGAWREVTVSMQLGATAPKNLQRLPRWLSSWKREFSRILIDLGPIDQPVCRAVGRYCDSCLLLLGPETCASPTWLRRHIDHLTQCDVTLSGSIVVATEPPAIAI